jgi:hypothetical protein
MFAKSILRHLLRDHPYIRYTLSHLIFSFLDANPLDCRGINLVRAKGRQPGWSTKTPLPSYRALSFRNHAPRVPSLARSLTLSLPHASALAHTHTKYVYVSPSPPHPLSRFTCPKLHSTSNVASTGCRRVFD